MLDIEALHRTMTERGIAMIDEIQGPPGSRARRGCCAADLVPALAEPRRFRESDQTVTEGTYGCGSARWNSAVWR